jgi:catabolite regulation protein CreA
MIFGWGVFSRPEQGTTGSVSTKFPRLGPNDKIAIDGFDDQNFRESLVIFPWDKTGGIKGQLGVANVTE